MPRSVGVHYPTGEEQNSSSRRNEEAEPKWKQPQLRIRLVVQVKSDAVKNSFIGTWNVRFMKQGKLEVVNQEMARVNIDILGICELKWMGMGEFMTIISTTEGKNPLEEIE